MTTLPPSFWALFLMAIAKQVVTQVPPSASKALNHGVTRTHGVSALLWAAVPITVGIRKQVKQMLRPAGAGASPSLRGNCVVSWAGGTASETTSGGREPAAQIATLLKAGWHHG
jgi:hypothetical protein